MNMLRSSFVISSISIFAGLLGFFLHALIAKNFGIGLHIEAYLFAISIPTFIASIVVAILNYELIPRLIMIERNEEYYKKFANTLLVTILAGLIVFSALGWMISEFQIKLIPNDSSLFNYSGLDSLLWLAWLSSAGQILQGFFSAILNARRRFYIAATITLFPYAAMILIIQILDGENGLHFLPVGMFIGSILGVGVSIFRLRDIFNSLLLTDVVWSEIKKLLKASPYSALAITGFTSYTVIDAYWGPRSGEGVLAALGYCQRIITVIGTVAISGPAAILVPHFARTLDERGIIVFKQEVLNALKLLGLASCIGATFIAIFSNELVNFLFERGSFGPTETNVVASTLRFMLPGMVAMLLSIIALKAMFCMSSVIKTISILGCGWSVAYFFTSMFFHEWGARGLAIAYSLVWCCYLAALLITLNRFTNVKIKMY
jgi:putative peptidoglycan lipid II flippase